MAQCFGFCAATSCSEAMQECPQLNSHNRSHINSHFWNYRIAWLCYFLVNSTEVGMAQSVERHRLTRHAEIRANQRGVTISRLASLLSFADIDVAVGRQLYARRVSRCALAEAIQEGLSPSEGERISRIAVIEGDNGAIVTVAAVYGRKGRHYRRRMRRFWNEARI
jgi:hypothetical protein